MLDETEDVNFVKIGNQKWMMRKLNWFSGSVFFFVFEKCTSLYFYTSTIDVYLFHKIIRKKNLRIKKKLVRNILFNEFFGKFLCLKFLS